MAGKSSSQLSLELHVFKQRFRRVEDGVLKAKPLQMRGSLPQRLLGEFPARTRAGKPALRLEAGEGRR